MHMMTKSLFKSASVLLINIFILFNSTPIKADATLVEPTTVQGKVAKITYGPEGRLNGAVLSDHTFVKIRPDLITDPNAIQSGDTLTITGYQTLGTPNKVFSRVSIRKGNTLVLDDSRASTSPPPVTTGQSVNFKATKDSSNLFAVDTGASGKVSRLVLDNGTTVEIPEGSYLDSKGLKLGETITYQGAALSMNTAYSDRRFVRALNVWGPDQSSLLSAIGENGETWMAKRGVIKQPLVTPRGDVDGILLADNSAILFNPIPSDQAVHLTMGTSVDTAGPGIGNQVRSHLLLLGKDGEALSLTPLQSQLAGQIASPLSQAGLNQEAPPLSMPVLTPLRDQSLIQVVLKNPQGQIDTLVLADKTTVKIPPAVRRDLKIDLTPGENIIVIGQGGKYQQGTSIEADSIQRQS
jgi:hypothetical protein